MNEQEKTKKLEMLPWQALFDLAISKEIDENDIKGKEKSRCFVEYPSSFDIKSWERNHQTICGTGIG